MKRSTKLTVTFILLVTLCLTALLTLSGCSLILAVAIKDMRDTYVVVDGVHYQLFDGWATVQYFDADTTLANGELQVCTVPESFTHKNKHYDVTSMGRYGSNVTNIIRGNAKIGELVIPGCIATIYFDNYSGLETLEKITVTGGGANFVSKDGALFRSVNLGYILEYYPLGKKDATYQFPAKFYGVDTSTLWDNQHLQSFEVEEGSKRYMSDNGVLYSLDGETLMMYPTHRTDDTFVAYKGMKRIDTDARLCENENVTKVQVADDSTYLKVEDNALYSLDGSELVFRPRDKNYFAIPSTVKVVSYNSLNGVEYLYVPKSVVVFLDTFVDMAYNLANIDHIYFESDTLPKYLLDVQFEQQQLRFGVSRESFQSLVELL